MYQDVGDPDAMAGLETIGHPQGSTQYGDRSGHGNDCLHGEPDTYDWKGAFGGTYRYAVLPLPVNIQLGQMGNYIFARKNIAQLWVAVYIGAGDLGECSGSRHPRSVYIEAYRATHLHFRINDDELDREAEQADLLALHSEAFVPSGCNPTSDLYISPRFEGELRRF